MEPKLKLFRGIVIAELVLLLLSFFQEPSGPDPFAAMDEETAGLIGLVFLVLLALYFISIFGLLMFKNWGSQLYLIGAIVSTVLSIQFLGVEHTFFADPFLMLMWLTSLSILYMSQVSQRAHFK